MSGIITLTTDFGERDSYVAAMKGVILDICPSVQLVDMTHAVPPQDIAEAAFFLAGAVPHYPPGTIHVVVVDPGVGTQRRPIVVSVLGQYVVCPDNGLVTALIREEPWEARHITAKRFMRPGPSATFHGRDVFAPVAAHLALGVPIDLVGDRVDTIARLDLEEPSLDPSGAIRGAVVHVDRFGNLVTNIHQTLLPDAGAVVVTVGSYSLQGIQSTYAAVDAGTPLALVGSSGHLEIAVNAGNAANLFAARRGDTVAVFKL